MKPLTAASNSLDRVSTAEELQLVVGVLIDLNCAEDVQMIHAAESNGISAPEMSNLWVNLRESEESSTASDNAELISLFSQSSERTN